MVVILVDGPEHVRVAIVSELEAELEPHPEVRQDAVAPVAGAEKDLRGSTALFVAVFVVGLVHSATIKNAHELPHLIVVELRLRFFLAGRAAAADGGSVGASHLLIVILGVVYSVYVGCGSPRWMQKR